MHTESVSAPAAQSVGQRVAVVLAVLLVATIGGVVLDGRVRLALLALPLVGAAIAVGVRSWRCAVYGLLLYLPISGLPIVAAASDRGARAVAVLAKDFLFVLPAYLGFAVWYVRRRPSLDLSWMPFAPLAMLVVLVAGQAFNPTLPNRLVGVIGIKVWLFYIPLLVLGYALARSRGELSRLLAVLSLTALVPATVGLVEAGLVYTGHASALYRIYGHAAAGVSQNFVAFHVGGGTLRRLPGTFSFGQQYYAYLVSMVAISYAWWRQGWADRGARFVRGGVWAFLVASVFLSGQRGAFLFFPIMLVLLFLLDYGVSGRAVAGVVVSVLGILVAAAVLRASPLSVVSHVAETTRVEFADVVLDGTENAAKMTWTGLGTGIDTNASRYAFSQDSYFPAVGGKWYEAWFIKVWLELGLLGLAVVLVLFGLLVARPFQRHFALRDPTLRALSAALLAYLCWNFLYCLKAQYLDIDPSNVYFWLFAGVLARLAALERTPNENRR